MPQILDSLPELYRALLPEPLTREVPSETKATCASCAMCDTRAAVEPVDGISRLFRPDTKCCTYQPRLPNYLVGALLSDDRPELAEGRRRMEEKIDGRIGVTPQWVKPPATYKLLYDNVRHAFGRSESLRCSFFEQKQGLCSIWPYREAVCSTWHCRYVAGEDGQRFWMTLKSYLSLLEVQLSRYTLFKLGPELVLDARDASEAPGAALSPQDLEGKAPLPKTYAAMWRSWAGRERELYRACYDEVRGLTPDALERIVGFDAVVALAELERRREGVVAPKLPERLRYNPATTVKWLADGTVALAAYSDLEALALPAIAQPILLAFTGQDTVEAVRERLRKEQDTVLDDDTLVMLHQHRILVEP